jgi:hypothetical protein
MKIELYLSTQKALFPKQPSDILNCGNIKCELLFPYLKESGCMLVDYDHVRGALWRCVIEIPEHEAQVLYNKEAV